MNRLLLDTCAAIWTVEGESMTEAAVTAISEAVDGGVPVLVSPVTAWERGVLAAKGRIASPMTPKRWFEVLLSQPGLELAKCPSTFWLIRRSCLDSLPEIRPTASSSLRRGTST